MSFEKLTVLFQIEIHDQIVLESLRSPGTFLHTSAPYKIDHFTYG